MFMSEWCHISRRSGMREMHIYQEMVHLPLHLYRRCTHIPHLHVPSPNDVTLSREICPLCTPSPSPSRKWVISPGRWCISRGICISRACPRLKIEIFLKSFSQGGNS